MTTYNSVIKKLSQYVFRRGINYNLDNIENQLTLLNNPHKNLKNVIHIAGTNGKGSTLTYIANALIEAGYKVGTYTSPHIHSYCERICINLKPIPKTKFCNLFNHISKHINTQLTEFEILTIMAIQHFNEKKPDFIILETGLGGRLDATNLIPAILSIITKIDLDHQDILGNTIPNIAKEKAGIIKEKTPVITINQNPKALNEIQKEAEKKKAPITIIKPLKTIPKNYQSQGLFQKQNLALAKAVIKILEEKKLITTNKKTKNKLIIGLKNTIIKGRYTIIKTPNQTTIYDVAHNLAAIKKLVKSLKKDFPNQNPTFILGILKRKNAISVLSYLSKQKINIRLCDFEKGLSFPISDTPKAVINSTTIYNYEPKNIPEIPNEPLVVITGSFYFVSKWL